MPNNFQKMKDNCDFETEIVISGISGRFPDSENLDEFWQNLVEGKDLISDNITRFNVGEYDIPSRMGQMKNLDKFDADYFSIHAKQAMILDPRARFILENSYEALVDAGINPATIRGSNTGVFIAGTEGEAGTIWKRSSTKPNMYGLLGNVLSMLANRVSYAFDFVGPSYVLDTACSASSVALSQAIHAIRTGLCDGAIVASAHCHHDPISSYLFHSLKMTSKDGKSKVFDASADGYVRAEAAAAIYICKKTVAKRSYATLVHAAANNDGYKEEGITFPSESQQEKVIRLVYEECGVSPLEVDYLEAHGTGTKVGDPEEMTAASKVFCDGRQTPLLVGSVKSNMGHSEPVSGLCSIAKVILSHIAGILPGNLHYVTPNPEIPSLHDGRVQVVVKNQPFNAKYVALNSMGFGGTNVHTLLRMTPKEELTLWNPPIPIILTCSGRTQEAVEKFLEKALPHRQNQSFVALTHHIHKSDNPKHSYRGFCVIESEKMEVQVDQREFPVSPVVPNISSMIRWDHSVTYDLPHHTKEISRQKGSGRLLGQSSSGF
ncbi:unnamed protein product [Allacma fusca]|uniref:Fatty acid synthase n=1 Tax=Allacma fusca TaxID=39272 RepID=A0A8J2PC24_9HEXA|nr:unnamed protein product [Allacma fusca]